MTYLPPLPQGGACAQFVRPPDDGYARGYGNPDRLDALWQTNDLGRVIEHIRGERATRPHDPVLQYEQVRALVELGALDDAATIVRDLIARFPEIARFHVVAALLLLHDNHDEQAHRAASRAIYLEPPDWFTLAVYAQSQLHRPTERHLALESARAAVEKSGRQEPLALRVLSRCTHDDGEATAIAAELQRLSPSDGGDALVSYMGAHVAKAFRGAALFAVAVLIWMTLRYDYYEPAEWRGVVAMVLIFGVAVFAGWRARHQSAQRMDAIGHAVKRSRRLRWGLVMIVAGVIVTPVTFFVFGAIRWGVVGVALFLLLGGPMLVSGRTWDKEFAEPITTPIWV